MKSTTLTYAPDPPRPALFERPDYLILTPAALSVLFSIVLWFGPLGTPNKEGGLFVASWVPSILSLGCFAKLARREK
ncbi:MAG: hypothetical protein IPQ09_17810 [Myxococcales bacterium]|nr:hypothetical protein [Myxococcales bacterium]HQY65611.1 hypothetical protein [Polyangiaceae bacterium]